MGDDAHLNNATYHPRGRQLAHLYKKSFMNTKTRSIPNGGRNCCKQSKRIQKKKSNSSKQLYYIKWMTLPGWSRISRSFLSSLKSFFFPLITVEEKTFTTKCMPHRLNGPPESLNSRKESLSIIGKLRKNIQPVFLFLYFDDEATGGKYNKNTGHITFLNFF